METGSLTIGPERMPNWRFSLHSDAIGPAPLSAGVAKNTMGIFGAILELVAYLWGADRLMRDEPAATERIKRARRRRDFIVLSIIALIIIGIVLYVTT